MLRVHGPQLIQCGGQGAILAQHDRCQDIEIVADAAKLGQYLALLAGNQGEIGRVTHAGILTLGAAQGKFNVADLVAWRWSQSAPIQGGRFKWTDGHCVFVGGGSANPL